MTYGLNFIHHIDLTCLRFLTATNQSYSRQDCPLPTDEKAFITTNYFSSIRTLYSLFSSHSSVLLSAHHFLSCMLPIRCYGYSTPTHARTVSLLISPSSIHIHHHYLPVAHHHRPHSCMLLRLYQLYRTRYSSSTTSIRSILCLLVAPHLLEDQEPGPGKLRDRSHEIGQSRAQVQMICMSLPSFPSMQSGYN